MVKSGVNLVTIRRVKASTTHENAPMEMTFSGMEQSERRGFTIKFAIPRTKAATTAAYVEGIRIPGIIIAVVSSESALTTHEVKIDMVEMGREMLYSKVRGTELMYKKIRLEV